MGGDSFGQKIKNHTFRVRLHDAVAHSTAPVHVPRLVEHLHTGIGTVPEVQLMADINCELRLVGSHVGAGVRRGFQNWTSPSLEMATRPFLKGFVLGKVLFMDQRKTKTSGSQCVCRANRENDRYRAVNLTPRLPHKVISLDMFVGSKTF